DVDAAVKGAIASKFRNSGQTCVCVNRFYAQDKVYDEFVAKLTAAVAALKVGNGISKDVNIGPLISTNGLDKVKRHVEDAVNKGAEIKLGGKPMDGLFFEPTVLTNVSAKMIIAQEEVFGPVAPVLRFHTESEVISMANDTEY